MISDQIKKRCAPECKEHYLDIWKELIAPEMLADKLEAFNNIRRSSASGPRRHVNASLTSTQKGKLYILLESSQNVFERGEEATNILENHINAGNSPPISVPIIPLCKRGHPPKVQQTPGSSSGRRRNQRGRM
ncbi:uncharacterized protein TNCV_2593821 [Trichonephila clavipes]|nr:uncharacterized protein TNCV_2593821 [Trichonephila clavipes]